MNPELVKALYQSINDHDVPRVITSWHASSIAKCPRALYFERKGVPALSANEPGGGKKLRWRSGHAIEATIRPELQTIYPNLLSNIRFTNEELDLTGEIDAYDPDSKTLISVKSVHDFAFKTINGVTGLKEDTGKKNIRGNIIWELKKEPYIHHQWQEHAYVLLLKDNATRISEAAYEFDPTKPVLYPIEQITYLYVTLGGLLCAFITPVRPEIVKRVADKLNYLNDHWKAQTLPECLCSEGQEMFLVQDQYCPWRNQEKGTCCDESLLKMLTDQTVV